MTRDRWSAVGLAVIATGYLLAARRYPLDTLVTPGPGIVPVVAGVALLGVAAWLFVVADPPRPGLVEPPTAGTSTRRATGRPLVLAVALLLYAAVLPRLGFAVSSFALVALASRLMGAPGWWRPLALALGVTGASLWLFVKWLGVPLP